MLDVRSAKVLLTLSMAASLCVMAGCQSAPQSSGDENTYMIRADSDSVGEAFGPVQGQIGDTYLDQKQYAEAIKAYSAAINNGYKKADVYLNRGKAYLALGLYSGSVSDAEAAFAIDRSDLRAYRLRGKAYLESGEYQKAVEDFSSVIRLDPGNRDDYVERGIAEISLARYNAAFDDFSRAIQIAPEHSTAYLWRAMVSDRYRSDYDSALKDYTKVIDLNQDDAARAYDGRGTVYFELNEYEKAISDFSIALETDPNYWLSYYNRGKCYAAMRQYGNAVDNFKEYLRLDVRDKFRDRQSADYLVGYYGIFLEGYTR
jgi:tetratricopeptide (TPR) repeat protein